MSRTDVEECVVSNDNIRSFILGGRCECIIENESSGNRFLYHIKRSKGEDNLYFVNVKRGAEYIYGGFLLCPTDYKTKEQGLMDVSLPNIEYVRGVKGKISSNEIEVRALLYVLNSASLPPTVSVKHCGRCGRCGRRLTDSVSMLVGLGPECRKKEM